MRTIEIARRLAELKKREEAQQAYILSLNESSGKIPEEELEAASYIFFSQGDYKVSITIFVSLYNRGFFQAELMDLMIQAFYLPNVAQIKKRYENNVQTLLKYPFLFRKDFPDFDSLSVQYFPFDDNGYIPFYKNENRFGSYINVNDPVIDRYFFKNLDKPILASDVYSQYQLEYLNDNVRKSEWVGQENHIYLHYTNWSNFCNFLSCLNFKQLLPDKKIVFLFEEEISRYPIDFKKEFGIDYSQYQVKPIGIREVNRLIWHTQLAAHNGGDFFNEIFYDHPNLLVFESVMFKNIKEIVKNLRRQWKQRGKLSSRLETELARLRHLTDKDFLVAFFLNNASVSGDSSGNTRIAPAIFFQPHFPNILPKIVKNEKGDRAIITSNEYEEIRKSPIFSGFKYIKTFTPIRRITSSYGATIRFMWNASVEDPKETVVGDAFAQRLVNRTFMIDQKDRLYRDSILVRFEDGKLNPKATFTALAEFLDIPYTESMTYCSGRTGLNPESMKGNDLGFDPAAVYRTYDEYLDYEDCEILEYFFRDVYEKYGYDFHYYKGDPVDMQWVQEKIGKMHTLDHLIAKSRSRVLENKIGEKNSVILIKKGEHRTVSTEDLMEIYNETYRENRMKIMETLLNGLRFVNKDGQPLQLMKALKLDPALLEQPLYH